MFKTFCATLLAAACFADAAELEPAVFNVPQLDKQKVDAEPWGEVGFRVDLLPDELGNVQPAADFDSKFRLAWNDEGLLVFLTVRSPSIVEADNLEDIWSKDSFELYMAQRAGAAEYYQVLISPGCDAAHPRTRTYFNPDVKTPIPLAELTVKAVCRKTPAGFDAEVLLPWSNLKLSPKLGDRAAFQLMVNHPGQVGRGAPFHAVWFPASNASRDSNSMNLIQLSKEASPPVGLTATAVYESFRDIHFTASAGEFAAGKTVAVAQGGKPLAQVALGLHDGRVSAELLFPMAEPGAPTLPLEVSIDGKPFRTIVLPDADVFRAQAFASQKLTCNSLGSGGSGFPRIDFEQRDLVEKLIGPYTVKNTCYDSGGNVVTTAEKPGQYGAVVEITPAHGRATRRFYTLFHGENGFNSGNTAASVAARESERQWWVNFKRKYYGLEQVYAKPFVCPTPLNGPPARTLRSGSLDEAGLQPDTGKKLDALCQEWEKAGGEAFSVCVVRHGTLVLHEAYGQHAGQKVQTDTPMPTASAAKFMAAILMMEMVDQGFVELDKTLDTYLPPLRGIPCQRQPTVRDLYLHVTGMPENLGDNLNDLEEIAAAYYPHITGAKQSYQATGLALGGKIVELLSGEAHPCFWRRHLLDPLECKNTTAGGTSGGALTTALDFASIGQMALNGGAYGKWRFFSEQNRQNFAPLPGHDRIGPDKKIRWGVGTKLYDSDNLCAAAFGHAGACGTFLFVDPERDVVAAMMRWDEGKDYLNYRARFFATIFNAINDQKTTEKQ